MTKNQKIYPESGVELSPFISKYYDKVMNTSSFGLYKGFIEKAIRDIQIQSDDQILDLGCGTGRNACLMHKYIGKQGSITGMDISETMEKRFHENCADKENVLFHRQRADIPFELNKTFDKVFMSFVIHGFPHSVRLEVIKQAYKVLKPGGHFILLDFAEFDMKAMPWHHRFVFKTIECPYAFDFIEKNWVSIIEQEGFRYIEQKHYIKGYVRLLILEKQ